MRSAMWESRSPLQRKAFAARVFHCDSNATVPAIFYLDIYQVMKGLIPWVPRDHLCAVDESRATKVFRRYRHHSASLLFHPLVLAFPLVVAPDRCHARIELQLTRSVGFDLLNNGHFGGFWLNPTLLSPI
jgi:hypothetical protein